MKPRTNESKNVSTAPKKTNQPEGQAKTSSIGDEIKLPSTTYVFCPVKNGNLITGDKDHTMRLVDPKNSKILAETHLYVMPPSIKLLYLPKQDQVVYYSKALRSRLVNAATLEQKLVINQSFLQLELLADNRVIGRTYDKPKKLQIFNPAAFDKPITEVSIKISTQWTVLNGAIVKIPEDKRGKAKLLQFADDKLSEAGEIEYPTLNAKDVLVSNLKAFPKLGLVTFTVSSDSLHKCQTIVLDVKNKKCVRCLDNVENMMLLPDEDSFLCIEATDLSHNASIKHSSIWSASSHKLKPYDELAVNDINSTQVASDNTIYLTHSGKLGVMKPLQLSSQSTLAKDSKLESRNGYSQSQNRFALVNSMTEQQQLQELEEERVANMKFDFA